MTSPPRLRDAVRAVIIDGEDRVLLVRFTFPEQNGPGRELWATPGGGIESGESLPVALDRELREEVGVVDTSGSTPIWTRTHLVPLSGGYDGQRETYFLVRVDHQELSPEFTVEQLRAEYVTATAWWTQAELAAATAHFAPSRLPALVRELVAHGPPPQPFDVGV